MIIPTMVIIIPTIMIGCTPCRRRAGRPIPETKQERNRTAPYRYRYRYRTVPHRYRTVTAPLPHRYRTDTVTDRYRYRPLPLPTVTDRYRTVIVPSPYRYSIVVPLPYHTGSMPLPYRYRTAVPSQMGWGKQDQHVGETRDGEQRRDEQKDKARGVYVRTNISVGHTIP